MHPNRTKPGSFDAPSSKSNSNATLLLVEDEPDAMAVLQETIAAIPDLNITCICARSAREAKDKLMSSPIDVVIADILMPDETGLDLLADIGSKGRFQPFIFITSLQGRDVAIEALRLGAFDFIEKPITREKIESPLRKALQVSGAYRRLEHSVNITLPSAVGSDLQAAAREVLRLRAMRFQKA